jgi:hypothetical protein
MQNVSMKSDGKKLIIEVDLEKEYGESGSGKSIIIASTGAPVCIPESNDIKIGLNVYRTIKKSKEKK